MEKAAELDPMSSIIQSSLASRFSALGRFEEAEAQYLKVVELDPDFSSNYSRLASFYSDQMGQFARALKWSRIAREKDRGNIGLLLNEAMIYLQVGDYASVDVLREKMQDIDPQHWTVGGTDLMVNMSRANYAGANEAGKWILPKLGNSPSFQMFIAWPFALDGKFAEARELILQAYPGWENPDQWAELIQANAFQACVVAGIFANSGDPVEARKLMDQTIDYFSLLESKIARAYTLAPVDCWVARGDYDKALDMLDTWVQNDFYSYWWINYSWPWWDDLRSEPRFQAAMQTIAEKVAVQRQLIDEMNL
jgi:tetratricopeptide (TPR) repeat protein